MKVNAKKKLRSVKVDQGQVQQVFEKVMEHGARACDVGVIAITGGTAGDLIDYLTDHWQAPKAVVMAAVREVVGQQ